MLGIERMSDAGADDTSRLTNHGEQDELQVPGRVMGVLDNGTLRGSGGKFLLGSKPSTAITSGWLWTLAPAAGGSGVVVSNEGEGG